MTPKTEHLGRIAAGGGAYEIGYALGRAGQEAVHRHLLPSAFWQRVTAPALRPHVTRMAETTKARFPGLSLELTGLADGLGLPFQDVMAWNARGDLLALGGEGCTTVQCPGTIPVLAHNEDGLPFLRGTCFLADLIPQDGPRCVSFCYPGSIPGHTFAVSERGLVVTVNNLRLRDIRPDCPRMVLTRAVLAARDRDHAIALLRAAPVSGGFHLSLAQTGAEDILSVSFGGGTVHVVPHSIAAVHANHALVADGPLGHQEITASSRDRQKRADDLLRQGLDPLAILRDAGGRGLPIYRQAPDDPDAENTLAQFIAHVGPDAVAWQVFAGDLVGAPETRPPLYAGHMPVKQSTPRTPPPSGDEAGSMPGRQEVSAAR